MVATTPAYQIMRARYPFVVFILGKNTWGAVGEFDIKNKFGCTRFVGRYEAWNLIQ
jgi:hypothetical protein